MVKFSDININCDLGEGIGNDALLMPYLTSCNIACGGHFGNGETMREAIKLAIRYNVKVGAHPSFPDKENFGRKEMNMEPEELELSIRQQVSDFKSICDELEVEMHHIKLHGALYNLAAKEERIFDIVLRAIASFAPTKLYLGHNWSQPTAAAEPIVRQAKFSNSKIKICYEAFIDRAYHDDLSLVSRLHPLALIELSEVAFNQLYTMVESYSVSSISGKSIPIKADTYCIHGDNKNALEILQFIQQKMDSNG